MNNLCYLCKRRTENCFPDDINNCQLPLFVVEPILQDMLNLVKTAAKQQYEAEKVQYEQLLLKQNEPNSNRNE